MSSYLSTYHYSHIMAIVISTYSSYSYYTYISTVEKNIDQGSYNKVENEISVMSETQVYAINIIIL